MATMFGLYPFLLKLYADGGYQGPVFRDAVTKILARVNVEIVKRSDQAKGFVVLPKRWVVERTFAWLGRCRRLAKDWENLCTPQRGKGIPIAHRFAAAAKIASSVRAMPISYEVISALPSKPSSLLASYAIGFT